MANESQPKTDNKSDGPDEAKPANLEVVREFVKRFQELKGQKPTGAYDAPVQDAIGDILADASLRYMARHGNIIDLHGEGGQAYARFQLGKGKKFDGNLYEIHNGAPDADPVGTIGDVNRPAVAEMMRHVIDDYAQDYRADRLSEIERAQRRDFTALGVAPEKVDAALAELRNSGNDIGEAQEKLRAYMNQEATTNSLFYQIWQMEMAYRNNSTYPPDLAGDKKFSEFAAVHDIVQGLGTGHVSDTMAKVSGANLPKPDDRYFPQSVYNKDFIYHINSQMAPGTHLDGALLGQPGKSFTRDDIAKMALDKCFADLDRLGIARKDFTRTLFEGDPNKVTYKPSMDDMKLIYTALGSNNAERARNWNANFGSLDVGKVTTRITSGYFADENRPAMTVNMTTKDILERMTHGGRMGNNVDEQRLLNTMCAYNYFQFEDQGTGNNDLTGDYNELRNNVYYPQVQRREHGLEAAGIDHLLDKQPDGRPVTPPSLVTDSAPKAMTAAAGT